MRPLLVVGIAAVFVSSQASANPQNFLTKAMLGDNSETSLGKIAAQRGASAEVRRYGAMLAKDHTAARKQVVALATRYHVPVTTAVAAPADAERHKLAGLRGRSFDREFARYMIEDHKEDLSDFEGEARSSDPQEVRKLATETIPVLRKHLRTAQSIKA